MMPLRINRPRPRPHHIFTLLNDITQGKIKSGCGSCGAR